MCGRFDLHTSVHELVRLLRADISVEPTPRYNVAPTQQVGAVRLGADGVRELVTLRWGLVPFWSKGPDSRYSMINARAETVARKPAYRKAIQSRRCLIPANGFFEWRRGPSGKQPYYIAVDGHPVFTMAGLWERWQGSDGREIESCTILTTAANGPVSAIHERMPVILMPRQWDLWLDRSVTDAVMIDPLLSPLPDELIIAFPVSTHVNNAAHDDPRCIEALDE
jgi:putative SOS response-associated peptidase YedK